MTEIVNITYSKKYISLSREELINEVKKVLSEHRIEHVLGVEKAAVKLAKKYGADLEKVSIAALTHDYAKEQIDEEMRDMIISENMELDLLQYGNNVWHGPVGAVLVEKRLGIEEDDILAAIRNHTVGSPTMELVEQIIFVADFVEPNRSIKGVKKARELAEDSLEETIAFQTLQTIQTLLEKKAKIHPKTIETYNTWVVKKEE